MLRLLVGILSRLPLSVLYFIVDTLLFPVLYHLVRYRRKIVRMNLRNSFPEWSKKQLKQTERKFYRHFCDIIVEIIYGYRCPAEEMNRRVRFFRLEQMAELAIKHKGCIMSVGHLGNWEWTAQVGCVLRPYGVQSVHIYRRLKNTDVNRLMLDIRSRRESDFTEMKQTLRKVMSQFHNDIPTAYGMVADQKPSPKQKEYLWLDFLRQDTPFVQGVEKIACKFNYPVIYGYTRCIRRGYYEIDIMLITDRPQEEPEGYITRRYAELLEENIREQPDLWLWSHNRWKYKRKQETIKP